MDLDLDIEEEQSNNTTDEDLTNMFLNMRLDREHAKKGALNVSLIWNDIADLDLHCITPSSEHIYFGNRSLCGGVLDVDMNASFFSYEPVENMVWEKDAPHGHYKFYVHNFNCRCDGENFVDYDRKVPFKVRLTLNGEVRWFEGSVGRKESLDCFEFDYA